MAMGPMFRKILNFIQRTLLILKKSLQGFFQDQCFLHASSLTFYTLLSIVPVLAVAFGLAKGFGFERNLEEEVFQRFQEQKELVGHVVEFARSLLEQVESGVIAGVGAILLFLFVLSLFWTIETSMNTIWKVKRSRSFIRMFTDYLAMMIICPFFFVIASSLTVFLSAQLHQAMEEHELLQKMTPLFFLLYQGFTLLMIWVLFSCLYIIMPNTRVRAKYGIFSALFAGTTYYFVQSLIIKFQIGVSQYNAIYGSFAALPLFLFWLQISWIIVLIGAEIAYHAEHLSPRLKASANQILLSTTQYAILLTYRIIERFKQGLTSPDILELSTEFGVPVAMNKEILAHLKSAGIIVEIRSDKYWRCFQPAQEVKNITLKSVMDAIDLNAQRQISINLCDEAVLTQEALENLYSAIEHSPANLPVQQVMEATERKLGTDTHR